MDSTVVSYLRGAILYQRKNNPIAIWRVLATDKVTSNVNMTRLDYDGRPTCCGSSINGHQITIIVKQITVHLSIILSPVSGLKTVPGFFTLDRSVLPLIAKF